jgi:hypothetical protein
MPNKKAEEIANRYMPQIKFTYAGFYDNDTSPFPATLHIEIPTAMLTEYASLKNRKIPEKGFEQTHFLEQFWLESGLAQKLMAHKDAGKTPQRSNESPLDMLEYLTRENICVNLLSMLQKGNLQSDKVEIEIYDIPDPDEDEQA